METLTRVHVGEAGRWAATAERSPNEGSRNQGCPESTQNPAGTGEQIYHNKRLKLLEIIWTVKHFPRRQ